MSSERSHRVVFLPYPFVAIALLGGCFTGGPPAMSGTVRTLPGTCNQPVAGGGDGAPLADATVVVRCPDRPEPLLTVHADAQGRFHRDLTAEMPMTCTVNVSKPGFVARDYPLHEVCADPVFASSPRTKCATLSLSARLVPAEAAPASPPAGAQ